MSINEKNIEDFSETLEKVINDVKSSRLKQRGPDYQEYNFYLNSLNKKIIIKKIKYLQRLIDPIKNIKRDKILDVGSGYGLNLIIFKYLNFESVKGVEIVRSMNENANLLISTAKKYCDFDLEQCQSIWGDAEATNFENSEFDIVFSIEVISHVPSFDRFMRETNRILKKASYLIISDGNNISCPYYNKKRKAKWKEIRKKELNKRLLYLKQKFPEIDPQFRASIALHNELLSLDSMEKAVPEILATKKLPMNLYFEGYAPVYSETGIWDEYGFYPRKFIRDLELYGFDSWFDIALGSSRGFPFNFMEKQINLLPLFIKEKLRPAFICYAEKKRETDYLII